MPYAFISPDSPLVLASASPRRKRLLTQLGLPFVCRPAEIDEAGVSGDPAEIACTLAKKKARHVSGRNPGSWILGADTLVVLPQNRHRKSPFEGEKAPERILGKPGDAADAGRMLRMLSGKTHRVITGLCIFSPSGERLHTEAVGTLVQIKTLAEKEIQAYIRSGEPFGKAGGYAIQGIGSFLVKSISGSYTNVVGLPLCVLVEALLAAGALAGFPLPDDL